MSSTPRCVSCSSKDISSRRARALRRSRARVVSRAGSPESAWPAGSAEVTRPRTRFDARWTRFDRSVERATRDTIARMTVTAQAAHDALGLSLDDVKAMYRKILETRMVSERILQLNRMGRTPFGAGTDGHEAAQIGAAWNIRRGKDWLVPYYRDMGVAFVLGVTPLEEFRMVLAKATDGHSAGRQILNPFSKPQDRIVTRSVCVATEFPHAVGLALAIRNRKEENIVFAFGGDGSTRPGDFPE